MFVGQCAKIYVPIMERRKSGSDHLVLQYAWNLTGEEGMKMFSLRSKYKEMEERVEKLEDLIVNVVLRSKAEIIAIRDILIEKSLVSAEEWDKMVQDRENSHSYFELVQDLEQESSQSLDTDQEPYEEEYLGVR
jgi:hypothetical protein